MCVPDRAWRVAIVDSGIDPPQSPRVSRARRFVDEGNRVVESEAVADPIGHGTVVAGIIDSAGRPVRLLAAQVLNERGRSTAATLAAAIDWALRQHAQLLHFSLGLRHDRPILRAAIERAIAAGLLVVAATPARGAACYPASYPGVIRATGDARCAREEISDLGASSAEFGACPMDGSDAARVSRGASIGAAHLSRFIVTHLAVGLAPAAARQSLIRLAAFRGPERRGDLAGA
jgi:subtilisin family serine protease